MNNKIIAGVVVAIAAIAAFLLVQNIQLKRKLEATQNQMNEVGKPVIEPTKPANPPGASPFDKPNNDPEAAKFVPEGEKAHKEGTTIEFDRLVHDFGRITEGAVVKTKFKFKNTGNLGLTIFTAQGSCGCTVPTWPKYPIKIGESDEIEVQFDSHGKKGEVQKTVTVTANTIPEQTTLTIKATIIPRDK